MTDEAQLTVREVAERLRTHEETVRRWLKAGRLKGYRPGGNKVGWRIRESALAEFIADREAQEVDASAAP
jgi:excisionase family DNA binding protein